MDFFIQIIVFLVCVLLSFAICFFLWMFLKKQNFYVDLQLQYKDVEKCSTRGQERSRRRQRPRVDPCEQPKCVECPMPFEEPVTCDRPVTFELPMPFERPVTCERPLTCERPVTFDRPMPTERQVSCKRTCSTPVEKPCRPRLAPMRLPSYIIQSDSSDSILDCCKDMEGPRKNQLCCKEVKSICSLTAVDEKSNRHKRRSRHTPEQKCQENKKRSKPKHPSEHCKPSQHCKPSEHCKPSQPCKKQLSDDCAGSDNKSFRNRFGSKMRFLSRDKKKRVECLVLVNTSQLPFNNQPSNNEKMAIVPMSCLTCSKEDTKCPELPKDSGDKNDSPRGVQSNSVRKSSTSSSYQRKKILENLSEGKVFQSHNELNNNDKTDAVPAQNVPSCSAHNLEKLREKRKERKKTLLKLQYESGKLDDIHKWMSGASNSED